jgi:hypothetical protein
MALTYVMELINVVWLCRVVGWCEIDRVYTGPLFMAEHQRLARKGSISLLFLNFSWIQEENIICEINVGIKMCFPNNVRTL